MRIFSLSESALTIELGSEISEALNAEVLALSDHLNANRFPGFVEAVPAYASLTVFYDLIKVRRGFPQKSTAFEAVKSVVLDAKLNSVPFTAKTENRLVEVPVDFSVEHAPDLQFVAESNSMNSLDVIEIFISKTYRVYMLGFLPGFAYMGEIDARIATPRRPVPRLKVPKGSVGIAGTQTGIYPLESPGGWQIIGKTDIELFTPDNESPCLFQPGDEVRFLAVNSV